VLAMLGLAWNVKVPSADKIALRRLHEPALEADLERG
jgi:stearoyl-CoA desaturase (delta-9 desaturase)